VDQLFIDLPHGNEGEMGRQIRLEWLMPRQMFVAGQRMGSPWDFKGVALGKRWKKHEKTKANQTKPNQTKQKGTQSPSD